MIGYLDMPSGLSGDMFLGCLVDAGWPVEDLRQVLKKLPLPSHWAIETKRVHKGSICAMAVRPQVKRESAHRHLHQIRTLIEAADLPKRVQHRAVAVFQRLAEAEAKVHGSTPEQIHFHEVGALDAIIDIVGTVAGLEAMGIERLYAGAVPLPEGWVHTEHGTIPLPAPATLQLLTVAGAPTRPAPGPGELVTPTGAALLAEMAEFTQPAMTLKRVGIGAGSKDFSWPNVARLWLGDATEAHDRGYGHMVKLSTNIDDMSPQWYEPACERLFDKGALDVWLTPVQMKKNRPGVMLSVLGPAALEAELAAVILAETTTLGVRVEPVAHRYAAQRVIRKVQTEFGEIAVKFKYLDGQMVGANPEYHDCVTIAKQKGTSARQIHNAAMAAAQTMTEGFSDR